MNRVPPEYIHMCSGGDNLFLNLQYAVSWVIQFRDESFPTEILLGGGINYAITVFLTLCYIVGQMLYSFNKKSEGD
jgi:hypothetical protein